MNKRKILLFILLLLIPINIVLAKGYYIPNNRETSRPPQKVTYTISEPLNMEKLYETDHFVFYFRDSRDVLAIYDKRSNHTYKTGLDIPFNVDLYDYMEETFDAADENNEVVDPSQFEPLEARMNTTYTGIANSLITIEYSDKNLNTKRISSASYERVSSSLSKINNDSSHWVLDINFYEIEVKMRVHLYLSDDGVEYEILDEEITGKDQNKLMAVLITPFLGAEGGKQQFYDPESKDYSETEIDKPKNDGYTLVPDGSGALLRYRDNNSKIKEYVGKIYGSNITEELNNSKETPEYRQIKIASLPVFGMTQGDDTERAFVAFATKGAEYMEIVSMPEDNTTYYNFTYPRFVYNRVYNQVYDNWGNFFSKTSDERNHYDVKMKYEFLAGDGSVDHKPASYVGMAAAYRDYLTQNDLLIDMENNSKEDIPIRIDFLMADSKKDIFGYNLQVATTTQDVQNILDDLYANGIKNMNSGLLGWQDGGISLGGASTFDFTKEIGSKKEFESAYQHLSEKGIDISLAQDYARINEYQMSLRNAVKHDNGLYSYINQGVESFIPQVYFAKVEKSVDWMNDHTSKIADMGMKSITISGISNLLYTDKFNNLSRIDSRKLIEGSFSKTSDTLQINAEQPNLYLLKYVDRYLQAPVFNTQYVISSDTVPFLQLVLNNSMEVYAPYSNFSFSSEEDILRMIDYNVYPSFILTKQPSYILASTSSSNFFSTQYKDYKNVIKDVYEPINGALSYVKGEKWINRQVIENGVVINSYTNNKKIIINYTNDVFTYKGVSVNPRAYSIYN